MADIRPAVHCARTVQAVNSAQWSVLSAETVGDTNCQVSSSTLRYARHQLLSSKFSQAVSDQDLISRL